MSEKLIEAALNFRDYWVDDVDILEMESGCTCEICNLIRACDEYRKKLNEKEAE